jgi:hypothetical protein
MEGFMNRKLTLSSDSGVIDFANAFSKNTTDRFQKIDLPKELEELYGIFKGTDAPDKKELRKIFHEKNSN